MRGAIGILSQNSAILEPHFASLRLIEHARVLRSDVSTVILAIVAICSLYSRGPSFLS